MKSDWISARACARILGVARGKFPQIADAAEIRRQLLPGRQRVRYHVADVNRVADESIFTTSDGPNRATVGAGVDAPEGPEKVATTPAKSAKARPGPPRHTTKAFAKEAP